ncbi:MAG: PTS sugar transporter subunit IIA, partial [Butyrivibrio sp.]|nr:PTS sugar transporter subunit IIA [Butyrivibrio sp.]
MKITDLLKKEGIALNVDAADQNAAIDKLIALHEAVGNLSNVSAFKEAILEREKKGSTAIGMGIAVPHGKSSAVSKAGVTAITIPAGIDYKSLDGNPSNLFFMIAAPDTAADTHLEVLSKLMTLLMDQNFAKKLVEAKTADEFLSIIDSKEAEKDKEEAAKKAAAAPAAAPKSAKKLVGVTACPTGIAHTFMAAEALELKAKELGIDIKVEKDGSGGAKDVLTTADIEAADAVIVACDKNIDMSRFNGKPVIITSTKEAIHSPEGLIEKATSGNVAVYHHTGAVTKSADTGANESVGRKAYKHLMNGVSHMLPFVIGG